MGFHCHIDESNATTRGNARRSWRTRGGAKLLLLASLALIIGVVSATAQTRALTSSPLDPAPISKLSPRETNLYLEVGGPGGLYTVNAERYIMEGVTLRVGGSITPSMLNGEAARIVPWFEDVMVSPVTGTGFAAIGVAPRVGIVTFEASAGIFTDFNDVTSIMATGGVRVHPSESFFLRAAASVIADVEAAPVSFGAGVSF